MHIGNIDDQRIKFRSDNRPRDLLPGLWQRPCIRIPCMHCSNRTEREQCATTIVGDERHRRHAFTDATVTFIRKCTFRCRYDRNQQSRIAHRRSDRK